MGRNHGLGAPHPAAGLPTPMELCPSRHGRHHFFHATRRRPADHHAPSRHYTCRVLRCWPDLRPEATRRGILKSSGFPGLHSPLLWLPSARIPCTMTPSDLLPFAILAVLFPLWAGRLENGPIDKGQIACTIAA